MGVTVKVITIASHSGPKGVVYSKPQLLGIELCAQRKLIINNSHIEHCAARSQTASKPGPKLKNVNQYAKIIAYV